MQLSSLQASNAFILWKREPDVSGQLRKVPYALDGYCVGTDEADRHRLVSFQAATNAAGNYDGVGFVFIKYNDRLYICGIDIDHKKPDSPFVKAIVARFPDAYIELSPSGEGVHIIMLVDIARIPQTTENGKPKLDKRYYSKNPGNGVECYIAGLTNRYFTYTGATIQYGRDEDQTDAFLQFLDLYMLRQCDAAPNVHTGHGDKGNTMSDRDILQKARTAKSGDKFRTLYDSGDITGYASQSNADQALMNLLAFWTRRDRGRMERLFSASALGRRDKWKSRADYRNMTLDRAIQDCTTIYEPDKKPAAVDFTVLNYKPEDYTDVGEASILSREYGSCLRHNPATNYIVYNGRVWEENNAKARGCLHDLTQKQLDEFIPVLDTAMENMKKAKASGDSSRIFHAEQVVKDAIAYHKFILKCRDSRTISGVMTETKTPLEISIAELDKNSFLLNTPNGEIDLRTGEVLPHDPKHYHTKITSVGMSDTGMELWRDFLKVITCGDTDLEYYLQLIAGQAIVGRVFAENLIIAYGTGRNGKSTFFNTLSRLLGDYSGQISAETLTTGRKVSKNWELADLRGARLIVAPELEEGTRLDASFVKKICSTDKIKGEKKYRDPFDFEPSHTVILFTNHLPRIGSTDTGTWRRLIVIPFNAVIEGDSDIKNYTDHLLHHAGGAALQWVVEGAKWYIEIGFKIEPPGCVKAAIRQYRDANDWLSNFILERCEVDTAFRQKSGELYADYRDYCTSTGEYIRSAADFKAAIEGAGYETRKTNAGAFTFGLKIAGCAVPL